MVEPAANVIPDDNRLVSARVLAVWLRCSRAYVADLGGKGILRHVGTKFPLRDSAGAHAEYQRRQREQDHSARIEAAEHSAPAPRSTMSMRRPSSQSFNQRSMWG